MRRVKVGLGERSYDIVIEGGILANIGAACSRLGFTKTLAVVSNPTVYRLYGPAVMRSLKTAGFDVRKVLIPDGERYKTLASTAHILEELLRMRLDRKSALVALGGGVIGDITGFAASTYMRGIDFVQVPTTLLAQVDSSVGGKTGVNHPLGKNMIGTFWQPRLVWIDVDTLHTLPPREFRAGMAEVVKYGIIWDEPFFRFLERSRDTVSNLDARALMRIIKRSCEIKADVVSKDERESGLRAILNYGHTIGHAVETLTNYARYLHGEAVAIGMYQEALLARNAGLLSAADAARIKALIESYDLPALLPRGLDARSLFSAMQHDKKTVGGRLRFVLPKRIGGVELKREAALPDIRSLFR